MRFNSLAFRLFASAAVWTLVVLPITAILLVSIYRDRARAEFRRAPQRLHDEPRRIEHDGRRAPAARAGRARRTDLHHSLLRLVLAGQSPRRVGPSSLRLRLAPRSAAQAAEPDRQSPPTTPSPVAPMRAGPEGQRLRVLEREIRPAGPNSTPYSYAVAGDGVGDRPRSFRVHPSAHRRARRARARAPGRDLFPGPLRAVAAQRHPQKPCRDPLGHRPRSSKASCPTRSGRSSRS